MSAPRRWLMRVWSGRHYVGCDLQGNRFFEYPPLQEGSPRTRRVVKYARRPDMFEYASGIARLPVQWTAWMAHTRMHPPTVEELQVDLSRRQRIADFSARIEARDKEERVRQIEAARFLQHTPSPSLLDMSTQEALQSEEHPNDMTPIGYSSHRMKPSPDAPSLAHQVASGSNPKIAESSGQYYQEGPHTADEAQPWKPKTLRRGKNA
ncbi:uncharacterized protein EI90DRAFT_828228 [Cantharellus anzutake]|uniref:uncharacterized protein n=1 Tax=Cantharellus anzutake TaxID=1750568 RepID=UPI001904214C|nr:uncharacterized protein EI90DRAFT_828228 [Cantharellus anzutake]KAF8343096.1 hypothetical protein EI90DRAFT_828228 [Cantharellus anzutake]